MRVLHVLHSLSAEGSPRLALGMLQQALARGIDGVVLPLVDGPDDLRRDFESSGIRVLEPVGWTGRDYISMVGRMRRLLGRVPSDGIVCYTLGPHVPIAYAARSVGIPLLLHIGNAPPDEQRVRSKIRWQLRVGRRWVMKHVACSSYVRDRVIADYGLPPGDVVAVVNGIDLSDFFALREQRAEPNGILTIGMVGSLEVHKDQATLIQALAVLVRRGVQARLELVGGGSKETQLRAMASELGVSEWIVWHGTKSDVKQVLVRLDVFGYSVTPQEGLGIALIEALAAGVPCVGSDVGACREVLADGDLGALVAGDADRWADAIVAAAGRPAVARSELARFDISEVASAYERLLTGGATE